jgi:mannose-1-phosphate guanylyltransferase
MDAFDAMILCAGLGTRLRPLTEHTAKPAVPLLGRPLAGYGMSLLAAAGFTRVSINTHWRPDEMRAAAEAEARRTGLALGVSHEAGILGTGGVFRRAREAGLLRRDRPLVVLNGDVLFDLDLPRVLEAHLATGAAATMVLRTMPGGGGYSPVECDDAGRIHRIGKHGTPGAGPGRLFTGVHVLSPRALDLLPPGESGIVEAVYARLLASGERVQAVHDDRLWLDLGDPRGYLDAHLTLMHEGSRPRRVALPPVIDPEASISPSAKTTRTAVGRGGIVGDGAELSDCVVWPGARVEAGERLSRTVVTPQVRVQVA